MNVTTLLLWTYIGFIEMSICNLFMRDSYDKHVYAYASIRAHINVRAHVQCKYICMYTCVYVFVAVNFDALAQASHFRIERRQVVFLG